MVDSYRDIQTYTTKRILIFSAVFNFLATALLFSTWVAPFGAICNSVIAFVNYSRHSIST